MSNTRPNYIITAILIIAGVGMLIWAAMGAQWSQTLSAQALADSGDYFKGKQLQIYGKVVPGSILARASGVDFVVTGDRGGRVSIQYRGKKLMNLNDSIDVLVSGTVSDVNTMTAQQVLTKCPSKYTGAKGGK